MVVHTDTVDFYLEIRMMNNVKPGDVFFVETFLVIASKLEISAIFAEAHSENLTVDEAFSLHNLVERFVPILSCSRRLPAGQTQDAVNFLRVKEVGLLFHASKCVGKRVASVPRMITYVELVADNIPIVEASFGITRIKPAAATLALAVPRATLLKSVGSRPHHFVKAVEVFATAFYFTKLFARQGGDTRPRVHYHELRVPLRAHMDRHVKVLYVCRVAVQTH